MSSPLAEVGEGGRTCCRDGQGGLGAACPRGSGRWGKLCGPRHLLRASVFGGLGASEAPALCVCGVLGPFAPVTRSLLFCQREVRAAAGRSQTGSRCSPALHHRGCIDWGVGGGSVRAGPDPPKPGCPPTPGGWRRGWGPPLPLSEDAQEIWSDPDPGPLWGAAPGPRRLSGSVPTGHARGPEGHLQRAELCSLD